MKHSIDKIKYTNAWRSALLHGARILNIIFTLLVVTSCEEFVEVDPPKTQLVATSLFTSDASATSTIIGLYSEMMNSQNFTSILSTTYAGMSSDEFISPSSDPFNTNELLSTNTSVQALWRDGYKFIYTCNSILEGLQQSKGLSAATLATLEGEARFMRAFSYFYLVNFFGDIPLATKTDYLSNASLARTPVNEVYTFIISDLLLASEMLPAEYIGSEKVRPNKGAAQALLARVYLYNSEYAKAEEQSSLLIANTSQYALNTSLDEVFLQNSSEAIWQLMPVSPGYNTYEGNTYILTAAPTSVSLRPQLLDVFETDDQRLSSWIGSFSSGADTWYYPFKYKIKSGSDELSEYYMVLRLAEQYLIRSEARAQLNNISGALEDLNTVRARAGLPSAVVVDKASVLTAIAHERQTELFAEWGHRWFDLKRTQRADAVLAPVKGATWQPTDILYPIPQSELLLNAALAPQNNGY